MENYNDLNTPLFSFNGLKCISRVVSITDGDTIKVVINFKDSYYKIIVRLNDVDTCETNSKSTDNKDLGIKAKLRMFSLITGKTLDIKANDILKKQIVNELTNYCYCVYIKCYDFDKYGRVLADVYKTEADVISFSNILISEKLAYKYGGKTKLTEKQQIELLS
jgi:endonuclease YncB( thermonuclease family)